MRLYTLLELVFVCLLFGESQAGPGKQAPPPRICNLAGGSCGFNSTCVDFRCTKGCASHDDCQANPPSSGDWICTKGCNQYGVCTNTPQFCTRIYAPVCGCDGKTYGNACEARASGLGGAYTEGECPKPAQPCGINEACPAGYDCKSGFCQVRQACNFDTPCPEGQRCLQDTSVPCFADDCPHVCVQATCTDTCESNFICVDGQCNRFCGGFAGFPCTDAEICVDAPDGCDPNNGGADCGGMCVGSRCMVVRCSAEFPNCCPCNNNQGAYCAKEECTTSIWEPCPPPPCGEDSPCQEGEMCVEGTCMRTCGGIAARPCADGELCIDAPDDCDPNNGGADCGGVCAPTKCAAVSCLEGENCCPCDNNKDAYCSKDQCGAVWASCPAQPGCGSGPACKPDYMCVDENCVRTCGMLSTCPDGEICVDAPDNCDPNLVADCGGICAMSKCATVLCAPDTKACCICDNNKGAFCTTEDFCPPSWAACPSPQDLPCSNEDNPCPTGQTCVFGECKKTCGGLLGVPCAKGEVCLDAPHDFCDPNNGGADCTGICELSRCASVRCTADNPNCCPCDNNQGAYCSSTPCETAVTAPCPDNPVKPFCSFVGGDCGFNATCVGNHCEKGCTNENDCDTTDAPPGNFVCSKGCNSKGVCKEVGDVCFDLYDPVCACNGKTYSNSCFAEMAGFPEGAYTQGECRVGKTGKPGRPRP